MTPVQSWSPADYYQASRLCRDMWIGTQPQYVIPGVLDAADAGAVRCVEPARLTTERADAADLPLAGALENNNRGVALPPKSAPHPQGGVV